jgi:putative peptidoglycan lipid II flippase
VVAFKLPNLLRRIFAEGAFSQAFVPILAEYKTQQGEEATRTFVAYVSGLLTLVLALVTLLGILAAPWIVWVSAPGFADEAERFGLTTDLLRLTFPYILLISLSSLAGAVLNTWNRFSVPAFVPTLLNLSMIGFMLFLAPYFDPPIEALGWAVLVGGLYQLPHLKKIGMLVLPRLSFRDTGVWRVLKQMGPAIFGVSVSQISLIINTIFASFLVAGSVSWMYYADRLMELPSGVLGVALGTILLPALSKTYASANREEYSRLLDWGLRLCFLLVLPCALALAVLAEPLTVSLFQYGKFTGNDADMTQQALIAYSVGLLGIILVKILAPGFYAQQNIKTPVRIAIFTLVITQLLNLADQAPGACRPGPGDQPGGLSERRPALLVPAARRLVPAAAGLAAVSRQAAAGGGGDDGGAAAGPAFHAAVGRGHHARAPAAPGRPSDAWGAGLFRRAVVAGLPSARLCPALGVLRRAAATHCLLSVAACAYNRPLCKQEARYAAGPRSSQSATPEPGMRCHDRQFRRRAPGPPGHPGALARTRDRARRAQLRGDLRAPAARVLRPRHGACPSDPPA